MENQIKLIADRLDEAMRDAEFPSQSALARASGVPQPTINRILQGVGKKGPEASTLVKLASACNVSFDWLHEGKGPKSRAPFGVIADQGGTTLVRVNGAELRLLNMYQLSDNRGKREIESVAEETQKQSLSGVRNQS